MKKQILLFLLGIFVIILIGYFSFVASPLSLATDSGFDTSYDSGGGSSWSSGSSSSSDGDGDFNIVTAIILELFSTVCFYAVIEAIISEKIKGRKMICKSLLILRIALLIFLTIRSIYYSILDFVLCMFWIFTFSFHQSPKKTTSSQVPMTLEKIQEILPGFNVEKFNQEAWQIYYNVQMAWMNFDYDALRNLVTDELYNSYYNQLQTLSTKNQKNMMENMVMKQVEILDIKKKDSMETFQVRLIANFVDYIVDSEGKVVRGNPNTKVLMTYLLTYVKDISSLSHCPGCGAPLEESTTVCSYCKTHIQATTNTLKLSKKEVIRQSRG